MDLSTLLQLIEDIPSYDRFVEELKQIGGSSGASIIGAVKPYFVASLHNKLKRLMLVVTAQPDTAKKLQEEMTSWCPNIEIGLYPEPDTLPYQRVASGTDSKFRRLRILSSLLQIGHGSTSMIITSASALMRKTIYHQDFLSSVHHLEVGKTYDLFNLMDQLQMVGYEFTSMVEVPGTMSHRGGIFDIYPPTSDLPARFEFFGNTIESIRLFDPVNQRSVRSVTALMIGPATELIISSKHGLGLDSVIGDLDLSNCNPVTQHKFKSDLTRLLEGFHLADGDFYEPLFNGDSLIRYLPERTLIILDDPESIKNVLQKLDSEANEIRNNKIQIGELPPLFPVPYFSWIELQEIIEARPRLTLNSFGIASGHDFSFGFSPASSYGGQLPLFIKDVKKHINQKRRIVVVSHQVDRIAELLEGEDIHVVPQTKLEQVPSFGAVALVHGLLNEGWVLNNQTHVITDLEIFGFTKLRRPLIRRPARHYHALTDIVPGEYVVHIEHGIARFEGVTIMNAEENYREYLVLRYAVDDRLYVPSDQIDRVSRYIGSSERPPALNRLSTQEWVRTKRRVKEATLKLAQELLTLYASREVVTGFSYSPDTVWQQELEASFPYVETPDQIAVQTVVKEDMSRAKPMDRLVCGDVGYGKTEVAIRAAFKAVMDNRQVAVLVPTTVLAQQHYFTFNQRMSAFPVNIELLSRFRTPMEQQEVLEGLARGIVDICIGTHRLLQKDVLFKNLGLLIIDEEQRFGVKHKEYLKQLRHEVDVLTLSATPIPRTLNMSLVGVKDMSTMETPPEDRLPIKTFVAEYNEDLIREAVLMELERNGQVFFVHNRVQSIISMAHKLKSLLPEASIAIAHGQMPERELESVMDDFIQGNIDLLVCTTIIESGLDMPNVNTLIVNRADKLGLTQLYQLRGRIGRGTERAYSYFLYNSCKGLSPTAEKRLRTIYEATELGSGFNIAMKDLEIRGAGSILGIKQSGHIGAVGFHLYTRLLGEAVEELKSKREDHKKIVAPLPVSTVELPLATYIPEAYVSDVTIRISLYNQMANLSSTEQVEDLANELQDRFGPLPQEVGHLLYLLRIKMLATQKGIDSISTDKGKIILRRFSGLSFSSQCDQSVFGDGVRVGTSQITIDLIILRFRWKDTLEEILKSIG